MYDAELVINARGFSSLQGSMQRPKRPVMVTSTAKLECFFHKWTRWFPPAGQPCVAPARCKSPRWHRAPRHQIGGRRLTEVSRRRRAWASHQGSSTSVGATARVSPMQHRDQRWLNISISSYTKGGSIWNSIENNCIGKPNGTNNS